MGTTADYDLIVIGSGPAGEKGAAQAAYFGKRVALIEAEPMLGGAAANTGTLPSKTLRETALMLSGFRARGLYGVDLSLRREATVRDFLFREAAVVATERARAESNIGFHNIDVYHGRAEFVDAHTVRVRGSDTVLQGTIVLIATGSRPRRPDQYAFDHQAVYDSDSILNLRAMPRSVVVVGAGVIGCEYACMFAALDRSVTLIDRAPRLLGFLDEEISSALRERMQDMGIRVLSPERVRSCLPQDAQTVQLTLESGTELVTDAVLVAAGRSPTIEGLNLAAVGVQTDANGIIVDNSFRTSTANIYAAGDVVGFPALASTSMEQARLAMVHAFDLGYKKEVAPILPYGIYTIPEISMAGDTEAALQSKGIAYVAGRASYGRNARGMIMGDDAGLLKLLFRTDDMKLLGVHLIGEQATELVHVGLTAMLADQGADLFIKTCYNYPTLGELYKYATYDAMGRKQKGAATG